MSASGRVLEWLFRAACAACCAVSGVVLGFCLARWVGPLILRGNSHLEMKDLGYMFTGATLGGFAGLALGVQQAITQPTPRLIRTSIIALTAAALAALLTSLVARSLA